jgi:ATP-dependent DNA ligase
VPPEETFFNAQPMLCKTFDPEKHVIDPAIGVLLEPKFDGLRCLVRIGDNDIEAYSRNGKPFWNIDHILAEIRARAAEDDTSGWILDGELYTTDWNLSMGIVKSSKTKHPDAEKVKLHVWDLVSLDDWNKGAATRPLYDRKFSLAALFSNMQHVHIVPGRIAHTLEEAATIYQEYLAAGYEGAILKRENSEYKLGVRSPDWLKWKDWTDADLTIVDAVEGVGKRTGKIGALMLKGKIEWRNKDYDVETEVGSFRCDDAQLTEMLEMHKRQELVGLVAEIRFQDITVEGACRFPVFYRLRTDKDAEQVGPAKKKLKGKKVKRPLTPEETNEYFDDLLGGDTITV